MNNFQQIMAAINAPGLIIIIVLVVIVSARTNGWINQFISALNLFTTPWIAILVIVLGMVFDIQCKAHGLPGDAANQIIGAGIGLLTGRALGSHEQTNLPTTTTGMIVPPQAAASAPAAAPAPPPAAKKDAPLSITPPPAPPVAKP